MLVRDLAVAVRVLAMVVSGGRVLLRLLVVAVIVMVGRLQVVMRCRCVLRRGIVMVLAGRVLLFLGHGSFLLETTLQDRRRHPRAPRRRAANKKAGATERLDAFHHAGLLV
jgi:hypothetical protein